MRIRIDLGGFFFGGFLALLGIVFFGIISGFLYVFLHNQSEEIANIFLLIVFVVGALGGYVWTGYLVARNSKKHQLMTAVAFAIPFAIISFTQSEIENYWYAVTATILSIPFLYLGASMNSRRVNKTRNEMDGSDEPLIR